jgi:hypothetical protein
LKFISHIILRSGVFAAFRRMAVSPCIASVVLSRPDQHVTWRGDGLPADPLALIDQVGGAANQVGKNRIA